MDNQILVKDSDYENQRALHTANLTLLKQNLTAHRAEITQTTDQKNAMRRMPSEQRSQLQKVVDTYEKYFEALAAYIKPNRLAGAKKTRRSEAPLGPERGRARFLEGNG